MVKCGESGSRVSGRMAMGACLSREASVPLQLTRRALVAIVCTAACLQRGCPTRHDTCLFLLFIRGSSQLQGWTVSSDSVRSGLLEKVGGGSHSGPAIGSNLALAECSLWGRGRRS